MISNCKQALDNFTCNSNKAVLLPRHCGGRIGFTMLLKFIHCEQYGILQRYLAVT
jgi:hypothetical protein